MLSRCGARPGSIGAGAESIWSRLGVHSVSFLGADSESMRGRIWVDPESLWSRTGVHSGSVWSQFVLSIRRRFGPNRGTCWVISESSGGWSGVVVGWIRCH